MAKRSPARVKDVLLEHTSRDVKKLQSMQSDMARVVDMVTNSMSEVHSLCDHLDHIFTHGLKDYERGYWPFVSYFTRSEAIQTINALSQVTTDIGRGRAWLYLTLNEQVMESYVRMFLEQQEVALEYYMREAFLRDMERLLVLQTLMAGLDFVSFDLNLDCSYLDYGASEPSSRLGIVGAGMTQDLEPSFISSVTPETRRHMQISDSDSLSLSGVLSTIFHGDERTSPTSEEKTRSPSLPTDSGEQRERREEEEEEEDSWRRGEKGLSIGDSRESKGRGTREPSEHLPIDIPSPSCSSDATDLGNFPSLSLYGSSPPQKAGSGQKKPSPSHKVSGVRAVDPRISQLSKRVGNSRFGIGEEEEEEDALVVRVKRKSKTGKRKKKRKKGEEESPAAETGPRSSVKDSLSQTQTGQSGTGSRTETSPMFLSVQEPLSVADLVQEGEEEEGRGEGEERGDNGSGAVMPVEIATPEVKRSLDQKPSSSEAIETHFGSHGATPPSSPSPTAPISLSTRSDSPQVKGQQEQERMQDLSLEPPEMRAEAAIVEPGRKDFPEESVTAGWFDRSKASPSSFSPRKLKGEYSDSLEDFEIVDAEGSVSWREREEERKEEEEEEEEEDRTRGRDVPVDIVYNTPPHRPEQITDKDRLAADIRVDDNTQLIFRLDIFFNSDEHIERLVQVSTPIALGRHIGAFILITSAAVYLLRRDGIEGVYSRELGIAYQDFDHIVIGLRWQSLTLVYRDTETRETRKCSLLTGNEAVSKSIADCIRKAAAECPDFRQSIPLNRDDETRIGAIEKELGSQTRAGILQYSLVDWEELSANKKAPPASSGVKRAGTLLFKTASVLGIATWKLGHFILREGRLYQYNSEYEQTARNIYEISGRGGCTRASGEGKPFALSVMSADGSALVLAMSSEEELTVWMQALCQTAMETPVYRAPKKFCLSCGLLLTQNKVYVLQEDWSDELIQLVASCEVKDVNGIGVDHTLPLYCTISYDYGDTQGHWLVCFHSEYELGKFERALSTSWKQLFQIDLQFSEIADSKVRDRAHRAIELLQGSKQRCDSVTKGRTEFTYSSNF